MHSVAGPGRAGPSHIAAGSRMRKKQDLPEKPCLHCGRPFRWRKKWEKVWDEVKYCSDRCRGERKRVRALEVP